MTEVHFITRRIEIDAGHRVPDHRSKCCSFHGHRYVVEATCAGPLASAGEQTGMVLDFGFLKEEMVRGIHDPCDHGMIFSIRDTVAMHAFLGPDHERNWPEVHEGVDTHGAMKVTWEPLGAARGTALKFYVTNFSPTAENLALHWFDLLQAPVKHRSDGRAELHSVRVYETPNCWADYGPARIQASG